MVLNLRLPLLDQPALPAPSIFKAGENENFADFCDVTRPPKQVSDSFSDSIVAGKNTYVYDAHTYHTKVPPQGIAKCIDFYTSPGAVVLDPFCGSGMTGIAALSLGRAALLSDLSPAAAFIAHNLCSPVDADEYEEAVAVLLSRLSELERHLYETECRTCGKMATMLYTVWSYGLLCSGCDKEFVFWDVGRDEKRTVRESKIKSKVNCPHCSKLLSKRTLKRTKRYPVNVGYKCCRRSLQEEMSDPNAFDKAKIEEIWNAGVPKDLWYPTTRLHDGVNTRQAIVAGIESVDKLYTPRALWAMAALWKAASEWPNEQMRDKLLFTVTSLYQRVTVLSEFRFWGGSGNVANYSVPTLMNEQNVFKTFARKARTIALYLQAANAQSRDFRTSVQPAQNLHQLPDQSVDYIFTDPPFGANINYSEMNLIWESWLETFTDTKNEAIVNRHQGKGYVEYENLLEGAFKEMRRVLKDDAWLTVVFHNSSSKAWSAIQSSLKNAGFEISSAGTFDKKHGTFKMFVSDNAVGYDLVLHCRKDVAETRVPLKADNVEHLRESAAAFVRHALSKKVSYLTVYLHVNRENELDARRLYSEWIAESINNGHVTLGFEEFRNVIEDVLAQTQRV
jgi:16S rRNA G966 N2-methylase RsmD